MHGINLKSERGNLTVTVVAAIMILATLGIILATITTSSHTTQMLEAEEQRAFYSAQSGLEYGIKEYLAADNVQDWTITDMNTGDGITADVTLSKVGSEVTITSVGKSASTTKTVETVISNADSNYVPDYAVFSKKPVVDVVAKDSTTGIQDDDLIFQNAPAVPKFDLDELRTLAQQDQGDGNTYYFEDDLIVTSDFNPPDGAIIFTEGKLKFSEGTWTGNVHFVAMDDISFQSTWRNSEDVHMTIYQADPDKKIWIEPRDYDDDPIDFDIQDGEVIPQEPFAASIEVVGCALPFLWWDLPITLSLEAGVGNIIFPFGPNPESGESNLRAKVNQGNVNIGSFPKTYVLPDIYEPGTSISIKAKSWMPTFFSYYLHMEVDSRDLTDATTVIKTLRDGDPVPNIEGFGNQASAAEYIAGYINFDTHLVTLEDNQAIYLVELYTHDLNSPLADFQDLVVLLSLAKEQDDLITGGGGELVTEYALPFTGGIITEANIYGSNVDVYEEEDIVSKIEVIRDQELIKDFLRHSVNGNARVILESKWGSKN